MRGSIRYEPDVDVLSDAETAEVLDDAIVGADEAGGIGLEDVGVVVPITGQIVRSECDYLWWFQDILHVSPLFILRIMTWANSGISGATGGAGGYLYGAVSTMIVGGLAAGAAFGLVKALGVEE